MKTRNRRTPNEIIEYDDHAEIVLYDNHCKEVARALIDLDDIDIARGYKWSLNAGNYAKSKSNNKTIYLHRVIMDPPDGMVIDHINHDVLDNRKENLRICTQQKNMENRSVNKNNTSKVTGVSFDKKAKKWSAYIYRNKRKIHLGYYYTKEEAIEARLLAEDELFWGA